jgi:hypothetical protein
MMWDLEKMKTEGQILAYCVSHGIADQMIRNRVAFEDLDSIMISNNATLAASGERALHVAADWDKMTHNIKVELPAGLEIGKQKFEEVGRAMSNQVSTIVTDFSKGFADILFKAGDFGTKIKDLFVKIAESIARAFIENAVNKIIAGLGSLASKSGSIFGDILGGLTGGGGGGAGGSGGGGGTAGSIGAAGAAAFAGSAAEIAIAIGAYLAAYKITAHQTDLQNRKRDTAISNEWMPKMWDVAKNFYANWGQNFIDHPELTIDSFKTPWVEYNDALGYIVGAWNAIAESFTRPESRESQRPYVMDMIKYMQEALRIDLGHSTNKEGFTLESLRSDSAWMKLPKMLAQGGIVTRPTLAMIGESGSEAVVPLGKSGGWGNTINVTVNAPNVVDTAGLGKFIKKVISQIDMNKAGSKVSMRDALRTA